MPNPSLEALRLARLSKERRAVGTIDSLVRAHIGLHSTDYATPYLSIFARREGFDAAELTRRLNRGEGLVRVNAFRNTVHVVHTDDLAMVVAATGAACAAVGRRSPGLKGLSDAEIRAGVARIRGALEGGPLESNRLKAMVPELAADLRFWLFVAMGDGEVIRAETPHARSNRSRYALTRAWVPGFQGLDLPPVEARRVLIRRAVEAFGPLTEADLAWWVPAPKGEVARALAGLAPHLRAVDAEGGRYYYAAALADEPACRREELGAWALPYEDSLLKGYFERSWLLAPGLREVLFPHSPVHWAPPNGVSPGPGPHGGVKATGEARPSLWWDGLVVGRWEEAAGGVVWQLHADVGAEGRRAIEAEIGRLEGFLRGGLYPVCG
jgi:hypothetical protein